MKDRLIQLRKALNLSMEAFGKKIGVGRSTISRLESGTNGFTDQMTRSICREFGVNYEWFVSGVGEMFVEVPQTVVDELCEQYDLDDFDRIMLQEYLKMDEASRNVLKTYIRKICGQISASSRLLAALLQVVVIRSPYPSSVIIGPEKGESAQIDCGSAGTVTVRPTQSVTVIPFAGRLSCSPQYACVVPPEGA